jgi:hypothetical protein
MRYLQSRLKGRVVAYYYRLSGPVAVRELMESGGGLSLVVDLPRGTLEETTAYGEPGCSAILRQSFLRSTCAVLAEDQDSRAGTGARIAAANAVGASGCYCLIDEGPWAAVGRCDRESLHRAVHQRCPVDAGPCDVSRGAGCAALDRLPDQCASGCVRRWSVRRGRMPSFHEEP